MCGHDTRNLASSVEYYMSYDRNCLDDTTVFDVKEDLRALKKFYKLINEYYKNHNLDK